MSELNLHIKRTSQRVCLEHRQRLHMINIYYERGHFTLRLNSQFQSLRQISKDLVKECILSIDVCTNILNSVRIYWFPLWDLQIKWASWRVCLEHGQEHALLSQNSVRIYWFPLGDSHIQKIVEEFVMRWLQIDTYIKC